MYAKARRDVGTHRPRIINHKRNELLEGGVRGGGVDARRRALHLDVHSLGDHPRSALLLQQLALPLYSILDHLNLLLDE